MSRNAKIAYVSLINLVGLIVLLVGILTSLSFGISLNHSDSLLGGERYLSKTLGD